MVHETHELLLKIDNTLIKESPFFLQEAAICDSIPEYEADTEGLLMELATAFDPRCRFHTKNQDEALPKSLDDRYGRGVDKISRGVWAAPTLSQMGKIASTDDEDEPDVTDTVDLTLESAYQHEWLAFLISSFAHLGGISATVRVCS